MTFSDGSLNVELTEQVELNFCRRQEWINSVASFHIFSSHGPHFESGPLAFCELAAFCAFTSWQASAMMNHFSLAQSCPHEEAIGKQ